VQFWHLTKPRVVSLIVFTAVIGMLLAAPTLPPLDLLATATIGIALVAGAAAAFNCLVEQKIDAVMARTRGRPTVIGTITHAQILLGAGGVGGLGLAILWHAVNPLTMWLTLATFVGYAVIYTVILKPATPQNIVIGGASGAMPPVLGWAAVAGDVTFQPLLLFLIIFAWTPPHFWALALYRRKEYERAGVPMLPVTHGEAFTRLQLLFYTLLMVATTLLPFATGMAGYFYLGAVLVLDAVFLGYAVAIWRRYSDALSRRTFAYSIFFLAMLFAVLMVDHYLPLVAA
jgi:protoheme IX farnesyltransferase